MREPKSAARKPGSKAAKAPSNKARADRFSAALMELEQRIAFDAAAGATVEQAQKENGEQQDAAAEHHDAQAAADGSDHQTDALVAALSAGLDAPVEHVVPPPRQVVVVDSSVPDYQSLLEGLNGDYEIVVLQADRDGVAQLAEALARLRDVDAIHIISHGDEGRLYLGSSELTIESMAGDYADALRGLRTSLSDGADILIYGCDFARGELGESAARMMGFLTGADIAASDDATGSTLKGGDWDLEYRVGEVKTDLAFTLDARDNYAELLNAAANIGNGALLVASGKTIYSVDIQTGKAIAVTTVPGSVGGVSISDTINSLAVDQANGLVYYTDSDATNSNRALFAYDFINNTHILIDSDLTNNGAGLSITVGDRGVGSGAATWYGGALYLGIENVNANTDDRIWKITFSANGRTIAGAATFGPLIGNSNDWGDFAIDVANNSLLSINTTSITSYNLTTGVAGTTVTNPGGNQGGGDFNNNVYVVGTTIQQVNPTTGAAIGSAVTITTNGTTPIGTISDGARWVPYTGTIGDKVYGDTDNSGTFNTGDVGLANVTVQLIDDVNGNGVADSGERVLATDTTDASGNYLFTGILPGNYIVRITDTNSVLGVATSTTGGATQTVTISTIGGSNLGADFGYNAQVPVVDLNSGTTPTTIITNGANPGATGWTISGTGAVANGGFAWTADQSTGTLTQTGITGWNNGAAPSGAAQLTFDAGWSNNTFDNSTASTLEVSIAGVIYARITTGTSSGSANTATITYLNGASGSPSTLASSTTGSWTRTAFTINLPNTVAVSGDLVFSYSSVGPLLAFGRDDIFIDNVAALTNVDSSPGVNYATTYTENGAAVAIGSTATDVRDLDSTNMQSARIVLTNAQAGDVLTLGTLPSGITASTDTTVAGQITITLTGSASKASYATAIKGITYSNSGDNPGSTSRIINVTVNDGGQNSATAVSTITVVPVNDAPVNTLPAAGWTTNEDTSVSLSGLSIADPDAGSATMTVTLSVTSGTITAASSGGVSIGNSGTSSITLTGTLTAINAYLASASAPVYVPVADANGSVTLTMITSDGGSSGLGGTLTDTDTRTITINPVNDAPVLDLDSTAGGTGYSASYTENAAGTAIAGANALVTDVDNANMASAIIVITNGQAGDLLSVTGTLPGSIGWSYNAATFTMTLTGSATKAQYQAALAQILYSSTSDNPSIGGTATSRSISVTMNDGALASNTAVTTMAVNAVNDAPVNTLPAGWTTPEDTTVALTGLSIADLDAASGTMTVTLSVPQGTLTASSGGGVTVTGSGGTSLVLTGTLSAINAYLASASAPIYTPVADYNGTVTLTMLTSDGGNTGSGGTLNDSDTATITITPVNDAPTLDLDTASSGTGYSTSYTENGTGVAISGASTLIADVDNANMASMTIVIANGQSGDVLSFTGGLPAGITGSYNAATYTLTLTGSATKASYQTALTLVRYSSTSEDPSTVTRTINVTTTDGALNSNTAVASVTVTAVNDAPVNTVPGPVTVSEDVLTAIPGLSVTDVDSASVTVTLTVANGTLSPSVTQGTVTGTGTSTLMISGTLAQVNAVLASMRYIGNADFNGSDTLTMTTSDGSLTDVDTVAITVTAVADITNDTITTAEDTPVSFNVITGTGGATADTFKSASRYVSSVTQPGAGQGTVSFNSDGTITYTPAANFNGTATFSYTVTSGGVTETATVTVNVTAVNDAPVNTLPASGWSTNEDTPVALSGLSVADVDAATGTMTVTLSVGSGTLSATGAGGVTVANSGSASITLTGTLAAINSFLTANTPIYSPAANANGSVTLTMVTNDGGNTGSGGALTDTDTRTITIAAVNDAPVNTLPATYTTAEDTSVTLSGIQVADVDAGSNTISVVLSVTSGTLSVGVSAGVTVTGSGTSSVTLSGSIANINALLSGSAQPVFTPVADASGAVTLTMVTNDGGNAGSGGALTDTDTSTITITPVNDAPVLDLDASGAGTGFTTTYTENGTGVAIVDTDVLITDVDNATMASVTLVITNAQAGDTLTFTTPLPAGITGTYTPGTNTLVLSGTATKADYQTALTQVRFLSTSDDPGTTARTISVTTNDGAANSNTAIATVSVIAVNDAPVNTLPPTFSMNEDTTLQLTGLSIADPDAGSSTMTVTLSVNSGRLTATSGSGVTVGGSNSATLTLTGTLASINAWLGSASAPVYTPVADYNGAVTLTMTTSDGSLTDTDSATITIAPVIDIADDTFSTNEDTPVTINVNANDSFENGTHTITAINGQAIVVNGAVAVTGGSVRLNADGTLTFTPTPDSNGPTSFTYTVTSGGVTETATVNMTVNPVNDAPVNTVPGGQTMAEDGTLTFSSGNGNAITVADIDNATLTVTVTVTHGTFTLSQLTGLTFTTGDGTADATMTFSGTAAAINAALAGAGYAPTADYNGPAQLTVLTSDGSLSANSTVALTVTPVADITADSVTTPEDTTLVFNVITGTNGATADSFENAGAVVTSVTQPPVGQGTVTFAANGTITYVPPANYNGTTSFTYTVTSGGVTETATVTVVVTPVNDAPVNTPPATQTVAEDSTIVFSSGGGNAISVADVDNGTLTVTLTVTHGTFTLSQLTGLTFTTGDGTADTTMTFTGTTAAINAALAGSTYAPTADYNGSAQITLTTSDGALTDTDNIAVTITPVADITDDSASTPEDTAVAIAVLANDSFEDAGRSITAINGQAILSGNSVSVTNGTVQLTGGGQLIFTPAQGFSGSTTFTYTVTSGGVTETATVTVAVSSVNKPPVNTLPSSFTAIEDTPLALSGLSIADPDAGSGTVSVTLAVSSGTLSAASAAGVTVTGTGTGQIQLSGTLSAINAYLASASRPSFTPVANSTASVTLTMTTNDNGNSGGVALSDIDTATIVLTAVNDAPSGADKTIAINEDTPYTFTAADFGFTDPNDSPANTLAAVVITTLPTNGVLALGGVPVTAGQVITAAGIANLTFTPAANANGTALSAFTFQVRDNGGTANGGIDTDPTPNTIAFDVAAVNDAPANTLPSVFATNEDVALSLTGLSISDVDAGSGTMTVTLSVGSGMLTATAGSGVAVSGSGSGILTLTGTVTNINAFLAGSSRPLFTPAPDQNGTVTLTMVTSDGGNTGSGGVRTDTDTATITVTPVNDAPVGSNGAFSTNEDTAYSGTLPAATDVENDPLTYSAGATAPAHGTVTFGPGNAFVYTPNANYHGTDSFTYKVSDGTATVEYTMTVQVNAVNDAPVATGENLTTSANSPISVNVLANDTDVDGDTLVVSQVNGAGGNVGVSIPGSNGGTFTIGANGAASFNPGQAFVSLAAGQTAVTSVSYQVSDGNGGLATATFSVTVTGVNDAPTSTAIANQSANDGGSVSFNVAGNFSDPDTGDTLTFTAAGLPTGLTINSAGLISGTIDRSASVNGPYTVTVTATDSGGATTSRSFTWAVANPAPVAVDDTATTGENTPITTGSVIANDSDPDGDPITVSAVGGSAAGVGTAVAGSHGGSFTIGANGAYSFNPGTSFDYLAMGQTATTSVTYVISDGQGGLATATLTVTVTGVNDAPIALADSFSTNEDTPVTFNVLANDSDVDGGTLSITEINGGAITQGVPVNITGGTITLNVDGTLTFNPNPDYFGPANFTYTLSDGQGGTSTGSVTGTVTPVQDVPVAVNDTFNISEDGSATINVVANDTDADGDTLTVTHVNGAAIAVGAPVTVAHGTVSLGNDGRLTFTPTANYNGPASFTYTISDGHGNAATATVNGTINAVQDPPLAVADTFSTIEDMPVTFDVRANDSDPDGDALSVIEINGAAVTQGVPVTVTGGTITLNGDGTLTFNPNLNYNGATSFTYTLSDGNGNTATATVTGAIAAVNDLPVAVDDSYTTAEDTALTFDVRSNDSDVDSPTLTVTQVNGNAIMQGVPVNISGGTITLGADGRLTFTPAANYNGTASFTYTISDGAGGTATATASIAVTPVNDAPVTSPDSFTTAEDTAKTFDVRTNDSDAEGDALTVTQINGINITTGGMVSVTNGTVRLEADGRLTFLPAANYNGPITFTYTVSDGSLTATGSVTGTVTAVNDAPTSTDLNLTMNEDAVLTGTLTASDVDGDTVTFVAGTTTPAHGTVTIAASGAYTYTPAANYHGTDSFSFVVRDPSGASNEYLVTVTVNNVNDAPVGPTLPNRSTADGATVAIDLSGMFSDADGDTLTFSQTGLPAGLSISPSGQITGTIDRQASQGGPNSDGVYTVAVTISDGTTSIVRNFTMTVTNPAPVVTPGTATVIEDTPTVINALANATDPDGDPLVISSASAVNGAVTVHADGTITYTPTANFHGTDTITYAVSDGNGGVTTSTITVTVTSVNDAPTGTAIGDRTRNDSAFDTLDVAGFFSDPDGDTLTYSVSGLPPGLTLTGSTISGTIAPNASGPTGEKFYTVTVTASDGALQKQTTFTYRVLNIPPVAVDDAVTTAEDTPVDIDVLSNDSDPDGDSADVIRVNNQALVANDPTGVTTANGVVHLIKVGASQFLRFTPNANYHGQESFTYSIDDGNGGVASATVTVTVTSVNDAPVSTGTIPAGSGSEGQSYAFNVSSYFRDADGDALTYSIQHLPPGLTADAAGNITGTVAANAATGSSNGGAPGEYRITVTVTDPSGASTQQTFTLTVTPPVVTAPTAVADAFTTAEDTPYANFNVLANDTDPNNSTLTLDPAFPPVAAHGTVTVNGDGTINYTPTANFNGTDTISYRIVNTNGDVSYGTVTVTVTPVDDAPTAQPIADIQRNDGDTVSFNVRGNFADVDGDPLTLTVMGLPPGLNFNAATGEISGTIAANASGPTGQSNYIVQVTATDPSGAAVTTSFAIVVRNIAPQAENDTASVAEDSSVLIDVLANDIDPDGDVDQVILINGVNITLGGPGVTTSHGYVELVLNGQGKEVLRFTPYPNYNGTETFTYTITDDGGGSDSATVTVTVTPVNDAPVATAIPAMSQADGSTVNINLATHFSDVDGDTLTFSQNGLPPGLTLNSAGMLTGIINKNASAGSPYTVTITASDGPTSASTTFIFTVTNPAPVAVNDMVVTNEDQAVSFNPITGAGTQGATADSDPDGDTLSVTHIDGQAIAVGQSVSVTGGTVTLTNANGAMTFTPAANYNGSISFAYRLSDGRDAADGWVTVNIAAVNDVPVVDLNGAGVGIDRTVSFTEGDQPVRLVSADASLSDVEGALVSLDISLSGFTDGASEVIHLNGAVDFVYGTASSGTITFGGTTFRYAYNGAGTLHVENASGANVPMPEGAATALLRALQYENRSENPTAGSRALSFTVTDDQGATSTAAIATVSVTGVNDAPVTVNDTATAPENGPFTGPAAVIANDYDPEGTTLAFVSAGGNAPGATIAGSNGGTFVFAADGTYVFNPGTAFDYLKPGQTATTSITYVVADGTGLTSTGTLTITVSGENDAPTGGTTALTVIEDTTATGQLAATDVDGDTLTFALASPPAHGTLTIGATGAYTFVPAANYNGPDSFTYSVYDGTTTTFFTVGLTVTAVPDAPVATPIPSQAFQDAQAVSLNVAGYFSDPDGDTLTFTQTGLPAGLSISSAGVITGTLTPAASQGGTGGVYTVTVTANDGTGRTATQSFSFTVTNPPPVAQNDTRTTNENTAINGSVLIDNGAGVDSDPDGDALTVSAVNGAGASVGQAVTGSTGGSFTILANGNYTFNPGTDFAALRAGESRVTSVTYTISDGQGGFSTATVSVTVTGVNNAPVGANATISVTEDVIATGTLPAATDAEGDTLSYALATPPAHGTVVIGTNGAYTFTPNPNYSGSDTFTYGVSDGTTTVYYTANVTVAAVNDAPTFQDATATIAEDTVLSGQLVATDVDNTTASLQFALQTNAAHGTVVINANGTYTYTPNANFNGTDSFVAVVTDPLGATTTARITVTVTPVNDAPIAVNDTATTTQGIAIGGNVITGSDSDPDGDTITVVTVGSGPGGVGTPLAGSTGGTFTILADGSYSFDPGTAFNSLKAGESRTSSITYTISDGTATATATLTVTVNGINDVPTAPVIAARTSNDGAVVSFAAGALFADADGDALSYTISGLPTGLTYNAATGLISGTITPSASGATGQTNFNVTIQASDGHGGTVSRSFVWTVNNIAPTAHNDAFTVAEGGVLTGSVLTNNGFGADTDPDGDPLTATVVTNPAHGILLLNANGTFTYTPSLLFHGTDSFVYRIADGNGGFDTATATITVSGVNNIPVATNDTFSIAEDGQTTIAVLANDSDPDGDTLTVSAINGQSITTGQSVTVTGGSVRLNADGTLTFTAAANFNGPVTFTYRASDGLLFATGTVSGTVSAVNDAPVNTLPGIFNGLEETDLRLTGMAVVDVDAGLAPITVTLSVNTGSLIALDAAGVAITGSASATITLTGPLAAINTFLASPLAPVYRPALNAFGPVTLTMTTNDGGNTGAGGPLSAISTATIMIAAVNDAPVGTDQLVTTFEDQPVAANLNVTDVDGDPLAYAVTTQPGHGQVSVDSTGRYVYTPAPNFSGLDSFAITVSDGQGGSTTISVIVAIAPVNDAPIASDTTITATEDTTFTGQLPAASDLEGDAFVYGLGRPALHGVVTVLPNGSYTYQPNANYFGPDSFTYTVSDASATSVYTVTINVTGVNDAPIGSDVVTTMQPNVINSGQLPTAIDPEGQAVSYSLNAQAAHGIAVVNSDGSYTYTPATNYYGLDEFTYWVGDGTDRQSYTVRFIVGTPNLPPVGADSLISTAEDTAISGTLVAVDPDGLPVTYNLGASPANGTLTLDVATGAYTYTPRLNFFGTDYFTYVVKDDFTTASFTVTINVTAVNDAPVAADTSISVTENLTATGRLPVAIDVEGDLVTYAVVSQPARGQVTITADGRYTYIPNPGVNIADSFTYRVIDALGAFTTHTVTVNMISVNDAPVGANGAITVTEDTPFSSLLPSASDPDGDLLTYALGRQAAHGTVSILPGGQFSYTPNANFNGVDSFTYTIGDGIALVTYTINVTVTAVNDAPSATDATASGVKDTVLNGRLPTGVDVDGDPLHYLLSGQAANGIVTVNLDGTYSYVPNPGFVGTDTFSYTISDGLEFLNYIVTLTITETPLPTDIATPALPDPEPVSGVIWRPTDMDDETLANSLSVDSVMSNLRGIADDITAQGAVSDAVRGIRTFNGFARMGEIGVVVSSAEQAGQWMEFGRRVDTFTAGFYRGGSVIQSAADSGDGWFDIDTMMYNDYLYIMPSSENALKDGFGATLPDGKPLPDWLRITSEGLIIAKPPAGLDTIEIRIYGVTDGRTVSDIVRIDLKTGTITDHASQAPETRAGLFSENPEFDMAANDAGDLELALALQDWEEYAPERS